MATTVYDAEEARVKRQLALAQALRDSGQADPNMVTRSAGGYVIPVSPWDTLNKVASSAFGGYTQRKAEQASDALTQKKTGDEKAYFDDLARTSAETPISAAMPTQQYKPEGETPADQDTYAKRIAGAISGTQDAQQLDSSSNADYKQRMLAQYMKGMQLGGAPAAVGAEGVQRDLLPKEKTPYTLGEGDKRYDENNQLVARGDPKQYKPAADSDVTMNVIDPKNPKGFKTIFRRNFDPNTQQEWIKPDKDPLAMSDQQTSEVDKLAKMVINYQIPPLPLGTRNPMNAAVMARVKDMSDELGEEYDAKNYGARGKALNAFSTGKQGQTVRSFNVMIDHLHTLEEGASALNNGNVQLFNDWKNKFKSQFGAAPPTTFEALKKNIQGELVKAITGGPGAESDRKEALAAVSVASSPAQIADALKGIRNLAGGQLAGLRREFKATTSLGDERFNSYLSPAAKEILASLPDDTGNPGVPPPAAAAKTPAKNLPKTNAKGWGLMFDGTHYAYVGPNNEIEEVK